MIEAGFNLGQFAEGLWLRLRDFREVEFALSDRVSVLETEGFIERLEIRERALDGFLLRTAFGEDANMEEDCCLHSGALYRL